jgi:hypothetical protein
LKARQALEPKGSILSESQPEQDEARRQQKIQRQLDEALADSFPASDPVSIVTSNEEEDWGDDLDAAKAAPGVAPASKNPPR